MANIRKWIAEARDLEESGDVQGALAAYRKALVAQEETSGFADLSLYNGLGDLFLRAGDVPQAIEAYESAAAQCEEQQLYANGIALCKKILRNAPGHLPVYRRVGRLFALSGLDAEAVANYRAYADQAVAAGRDDLGLEGLREMVELTADEEAAVELADTFAAQDRVGDAVAMLRTARERRERQGRDFVTILRKIQELQPRGGAAADPDTPTEPGSSPVPKTSPATPSSQSSEAPRVKSRPDATPGVATGSPAPRAHATELGTQETRDTPATDLRTQEAPVAPLSLDDADMGEITRELQRVLSQFSGDDRFRYALPLIEHLLELQPGRFDLLHRKLAYAFALGEEEAAISAYLALGECLDSQLDSFTLRTLSTTTELGAVTAAVKVEESSKMAPGS